MLTINRLNTWTFLLSLLAISACNPDSSIAVDGGLSEKQAIKRIVMDNIETHVQHLAADDLEGRMTGEPGYDAAARYVADFYAEHGVEPGGSDGYYQPVSLGTYLLDTDAASLIVHSGGGDTRLEYREDFGMFADEVRADVSVRAEVVLAGFGVHAPELGYSDYEGVNVEGKIVALFSGAPESFESTQRAYFASSRTKAREAISRGAVGFIALLSRDAVERFPWERYKAIMGKRPGMTWITDTGDAADYFAENRGSVVISSEASEVLFAAAPISFNEARDAIEAGAPTSMPLGVEVTMRTRSTHDALQSPNVIGVVRGNDPELAQEYVVYTAHLDHLGRGREVDGDDLYNGAYDNAMGVAIMMEAARAFSLHPPKRSVMFIALTAEERGLLGSDFFVNYPTVPIQSVVANINLDMPLFLYPVGDLIAFGAEHSSLGASVEKAAIAEEFVLSPDPMPEENLFVRSDQYSFVRKGVPSIYLVPGHTSLDPAIDGKAAFDVHIKTHYHQPSDDLSRPVHWESVQRFARANARIGLEVANAAARPAWNEGNFFGEKFGRVDDALATSGHR